jgi:hypothetical protein
MQRKCSGNAIGGSASWRPSHPASWHKLLAQGSSPTLSSTDRFSEDHRKTKEPQAKVRARFIASFSQALSLGRPAHPLAPLSSPILCRLRETPPPPPAMQRGRDPSQTLLGMPGAFQALIASYLDDVQDK